MAKTGFTTNSNETKKLWEEKVFREMEKESYFKKFRGTGPDSIIQEKTALEKDSGDRIRFTLVNKLSAAGVTEGTQLEGNEEKLNTYTHDLTLSQYRHAVRDDGAMSRQRAVFSIEDEHKNALQVWAREKIDSLCFTALQTSPTKCFYWTTGDVMTATTLATAQGAVDNTDASCKLTLDKISALKTWALTGGGRVYNPLRPVRVDGQDHLVLLTHPDALFDLKQTTAYQSAAQYAMERGKSNPLFTGASLVWDNVIVHAHENMNIGDGGSNHVYANAVLMGAQSLLFGWGMREKFVQKNFDYENEKGYAWGVICGVNKPVFNSKDYGSIMAVFARTNVSGL